MQADARPTGRNRIRARIREGIRRSRGGLIRLQSGPVPVPPPLPPNLGDDREAAELERDVRALHDHYALGVGAGAPRRRMLRPLITWSRRVANVVLRPMLDHQSTYNGAVARAVSVLRNQGIRHEQLLVDFRETLREHAKALGEHTNALLDIERTARSLEREVAPLVPRQLDVDQFALANAFRGTEASVKERQERYVRRFAGRSNVIDLGCGRGEFLELLREADIVARGVDLDGRMVEHCRAKGLTVEQRDALDYLAGLPEESVGGIFVAQVIEHLAAVDVVRLVREARRVLDASGVLLVESVNPESLMTFAEFYVDPTHVRPYHAQSIRWLLEHEGFIDVDVELSVEPDAQQPLPPLASSGIAAPAFDSALVGLNTLLYGQRAYAVVGETPPAAS